MTLNNNTRSIMIPWKSEATQGESYMHFYCITILHIPILNGAMYSGGINDQLLWTTDYDEGTCFSRVFCA